MTDQELIQALREHAEWTQEDDWEMPITMGDDMIRGRRPDSQPEHSHCGAPEGNRGAAGAVAPVDSGNGAAAGEWRGSLVLV